MIPAKLEELAKEWVEAHKDRVEKYIVREDDDRLSFIVMMSRAQYDWELEDELTDLDLKLMQEHNINVNVMALPKLAAEDFDYMVEQIASGEED